MPSPPEQLLQKPSNLKAYLLLTLTTTCWAMNAILGRLAVDQVSPLALVSLRWLLVVILLLIFAQSHLRRDWAILKNHLLYILVMGAFGFTGFNMLFYLSAHTTTAINIGILQGAIPVFVLMLAFLIFKERVTKLQSIGVAVTIFGVVIIASGGSVERLANLEVNEGDALSTGGFRPLISLYDGGSGAADIHPLHFIGSIHGAFSGPNANRLGRRYHGGVVSIYYRTNCVYDRGPYYRAGTRRCIR